jgi:hypothetical protein
METTISLNGNKSIATVMQEFNKTYPYLTIWLYSNEDEAKNASWSHIPFDKTISESRIKRGNDISILPNETIDEIENKFEKELGIYANICYRNNERKWYKTGFTNRLTLFELNMLCSQFNCVCGEWK